MGDAPSPTAGGAGNAAGGFDAYDFTGTGGTTRGVLRRGAGRGVLLLHELPGLTPSCLRLATRIAEAGFAVHVPLLFGSVGERAFVRNVARLCVSREFALLARDGPSPVTGWLRELCGRIHAQCGGPGIGVVGMCLTGGFVLSTMLEPAVLAAVTCQPALPVAPWTRARQRAVGIPPREIAQAVRRSDADGVDLLGLRFSEDRLCPARRFDALAETFGSRFTRLEIDSGAGNPHGLGRSAHSVLTEHFVDEAGHPTRDALAATLAFLAERLSAGAAGDRPPAAPA